MRVCVDCNVEKPLTDFLAYEKFCKKCRYIRYKDTPRKYVKVVCPNCNQERDMRQDSYAKRKSDMCMKCSPLFNEQLFVSSHKLPIDHPLYIRWNCMKHRCKDVDKRNSYLDKGIIVCDDWLDYAKFYTWSISNGFEPHLELDRIDENKGYSPDNCQWITHKENTNKIKCLFGRNPEDKIELPKTITCECGSQVLRIAIARHRRTQKHLQFLEQVK